MSYIPEQFRTKELCETAITDYGYWLKELPSALMSEEFCRLAVNSYGKALEFVPDQYMTKKLIFAAVQQDNRALKYTDVNKLSAEEYTEVCRLAFGEEL
jgi:hypothetical protein